VAERHSGGRTRQWWRRRVRRVGAKEVKGTGLGPKRRLWSSKECNCGAVGVGFWGL
jgi:hypothetical protein